jgi:ParB-like chromosome segregation protein Spo0J
MRADSHYIDHLDSHTATTPLRLIDTHAIATGHQGLDLPSPEFVDSIRQHGILQPLIVMNRNGEYHVVAGRRRLAAAVTAGLRQVPCLVQRFDPDQAAGIAEATNLPATRPEPAPVPALPPAAIEAARAELTQVLSGLMTSATLLSNDSTLTQALAADLVRAETTRAMDLLIALGVLSDEMPMARVEVAVTGLLHRAARSAAAGNRLRGIALRVEEPAEALFIRGDEQLLATVVSGLLTATVSLIEGVSGASVALSAEAGGPGSVSISVSQQAMAVPASWIAGAFDSPWPVRSGRAALVMLQSARKVADAHGGSIAVEAVDGGTTFRLTLPAL